MKIAASRMGLPNQVTPGGSVQMHLAIDSTAFFVTGSAVKHVLRNDEGVLEAKAYLTRSQDRLKKYYGLYLKGPEKYCCIDFVKCVKHLHNIYVWILHHAGNGGESLYWNPSLKIKLLPIVIPEFGILLKVFRELRWKKSEYAFIFTIKDFKRWKGKIESEFWQKKLDGGIFVLVKKGVWVHHEYVKQWHRDEKRRLARIAAGYRTPYVLTPKFKGYDTPSSSDDSSSDDDGDVVTST